MSLDTDEVLLFSCGKLGGSELGLEDPELMCKFLIFDIIKSILENY